MVDKLQELIASGPNPRYTMKSLVLERYHDILQARRLMRTWADITVALGLDKKRWKDLSMSFRRVDAGVKAGKLAPGKAASISGFRATHNGSGNNNAGAGAKTSGRINIDDPANQL